MPDSMCVDSEGVLWIALWGGVGLGYWNPATGDLRQRLALPALNVTSCAFGKDALEELYITTPRLGTDHAGHPPAEGLFDVKLGVGGLPSYKFDD